MIDVQNRISEIMNRINEIKNQFQVDTNIRASFKDKIEEIQEKIYGQEKIDTTKYNDIIKSKSLKYAIPESLISSMIQQESGYNEKAVSPKGAKGLMQLMPQTAELMGVKDIFNPEENIEGGVKYLKNLLERFDGDVVKALAAYNAGPEIVEKNKGIPNYNETKNYISRIINNLDLELD